jgi:hypothetical protein
MGKEKQLLFFISSEWMRESAFSLVAKDNILCVGGRGLETPHRMGVFTNNYEI